MENVILVGLISKGDLSGKGNLEELETLAWSAGGLAIEHILQKRETPDPAYLIGKGKTLDLARLAQKHGVHCVIFDEELTPTQQRNLEEAVGVKIIDRTRLILDIFAHRARTKEGILQVELAQNMYRLSRLTGRTQQYSQQWGGIGTRGPGERELEYDRRRVRARIQRLKRELEGVRQERATQRAKRIEEGISQVAIIGYTNVGKSSLLNCLTANGPNSIGSKTPIYADNRYFATLDPTTRRVILPSGVPALFSDTVGFISKLPTLLIASFRATLEEIKWADILLEVSDPTLPANTIDKQRASVQQILEEIKVGTTTRIRVFSKADLITSEEKKTLIGSYPDYFFVSSKTAEGVPTLLARLEETLMSQWPTQTLTLKPKEGHLLHWIYSVARVSNFVQASHGKYKITLRAPKAQLDKIKGVLKTKAIKQCP